MPANASVAKGLTARFSALGSYSDNEVRDITEEARWTASTSAVSLLQESPGLVKGVEVGVATVRAAVVDVAGAADLEVTAAALVAIAVEPATSIVAVGEGVKLAATGSYADGTTRDITDEADWESITPGVVLRSGKKGTALGAVEGTSVIAAKMGGIAGSAVVRVEPAIVTAINIVPINATAAVGETLHFQATSMSSSGSEQDITSLVVWHSSNAAVLKMGSTADDRNDGTALARGSVAITAAFSGLRGSTTLNVR
jgi:uncharacterized protein YjdB